MAAQTEKRVQAQFTSVLPSGLLTELDEERLLATIVTEPAVRGGEHSVSGRISSDAGRTWGDPFPYQQEGRPFTGIPRGQKAIIRLRDGSLGIIYCRDGQAGNLTTRQWFFTTSADEGRNWGPGRPMDLSTPYDIANGTYVHYQWGAFFQLNTGRIIAPAYWYMGGRHPETPPAKEYPAKGLLHGKTVRADGHLYEAAMGGCFVYYSDDGKEWNRSTGSIMVWPLPGEVVGGFGACWEPVGLELRDGRLLLFLRTNVGRLFQSFSADGGEHWSLATPTVLATGDVPCWLGRLATTGDLLVIWNQSSTEEVERGYSRGRLSIALSQDKAQTWGHYQTVERSEGMAAVDQVELPPIKHVRARVDLGVFPDGYYRSHYPQLAFVQGKALLIYQHDTYPEGTAKREYKLMAVEEGDLYR